MSSNEPDVDPWPTPDASTYERAARAKVTAEGYDKTLDAEEFEALVARYAADPNLRVVVDAVWADRLPTPQAYHQARRAVVHHRRELGNVRARVAEEIARDFESRDHALNGLRWQEMGARIAREHGKQEG